MLLICQNHAQYFTRFHIPKIKKNTVMVATICLTLFQYIIKNFTHINIRLSILNVNSFVNHVKKSNGASTCNICIRTLCSFVYRIKAHQISIIYQIYIAVDHDIYNISQFDHYQINEPIYFCQFISCFSFKINNFWWVIKCEDIYRNSKF